MQMVDRGVNITMNVNNKWFKFMQSEEPLRLLCGLLPLFSVLQAIDTDEVQE